MPNRKEYIDFLTEWLSPLGVIHSRSMMGGHTFYCDGAVFAIAAHNTFYLKVDYGNRPRFEALGLQPFRPFPDRPEVMQYYQPPAEFFEDPESMENWSRPAIEAGRRAQAKKKPK
jgi:DNA transformation protein